MPVGSPSADGSRFASLASVPPVDPHGGANFGVCFSAPPRPLGEVCDITSSPGGPDRRPKLYPSYSIKITENVSGKRSPTELLKKLHRDFYRSSRVGAWSEVSRRSVGGQSEGNRGCIFRPFREGEVNSFVGSGGLSSERFRGKNFP